MRITKFKLRRIIRNVITESAFDSPDRGQITSIAGTDMFGDHRTFFEKARQANEENPGALDLFIDWAYEASEVSLSDWMTRSKEASWVGMNTDQWENIWHYVEEMSAESFIKELM